VSCDARPLAVCLKGPTAAGKTNVALGLARALPFQIISVDSALVYRGMDIGTAKPAAAVLAQAPHRLIDIRDPWETYSAGDFRRDARAAMDEITATGQTPLLVGGTMLYFHALQAGLAPLPNADPGLRAEIDREAADKGWPELHSELCRVDPAAAGHIKPSDAQRIQRALEVYRLTGEPLSELQRLTEPDCDYRFLNIGLIPEGRALLHRRIESRFHKMIDSGLVQEVEGLLKHKSMTEEAVSMRAVGYRQILQHLRNEISLKEAKRRAIFATGRLAKRQLSWLRAEADLIQVNCMMDDVLDQVHALLIGDKSFVQQFA
jgi:tRNA dimethylallyltransferase